MPVINAESITVFVSYSHDSPEHLERVQRLSDRLRRDGIDCIIDQYEMSAREGWPRWTMSQIEEARFVLVVCTEIYHRRVRGKEETGKGLGAKWEGAILTQELYDSEANNDKFVPVLFSSEDSAHVPVYLRGATRYVLGDDYEDLYRYLSNQPKHLKPALGTRRSVPPLDRKEDFLPVPESHDSGQPGVAGYITSDAERSLNQRSKSASDEKTDTPTNVRSHLRASWILASLAGFAALVLVLLWLAPLKPGPDPHKSTNLTAIAIYRVRVTVLNPQQSAINDAEVTSSVSGERKKVDGGWEFDIPAASKPADGKVTVYATKRDASLYGQEDLVLDKDPNPTIRIPLREGEPPMREAAPPNPSNKSGGGSPVKASATSSERTLAHVRGRVIDTSSQGIVGAWVYVVGQESGRVQTGPNGEFDLPAYKAEGQSVRLHAEKEGYAPEEQHHLAGSHPATVILRRR